MWEDIDTDSIDERLFEDGLYSMLAKFEPRHAEVVMLRNGYDRTYKEIGDLFGFTPTRAREIDLKALRILNRDEEKFFLKLDIPWINRYYKNIELVEKREAEEQERWNREWHKKCIEKKIAEQKEQKARAKLKIVDSEIPRPEAIVKPYSPELPRFPPLFVKLLYNNMNEPYLHVDQAYGSIDRRLDPETYDKWLVYLLNLESLR